MHVRQLALTNFRNYVRLGLNLGPGVTVFWGENAQGKSNLLEAVHVLATTRSLRTMADRELVHWRALEENAPFARLEAQVSRQGGGLHVELLLKREPPQNVAASDGLQRPAVHPMPSGTFSKTIKVNGLPSRATQLVGQINVVLFSPEDVALASGPPTGRRRYLDITNSQVDPSYLRALQRYNRVLVPRNQLLRQVRERRQPLESLHSWNEEQVSLGSIVLSRRLKMIASINTIIGERFRQLSGSQQDLRIVYLPTSLSASQANHQEANVAEGFRARLAEVAGREREQAVSLIGPHRDDFVFELDGVAVGTYGSRGQQRLAVLALKLAEVEFMQSEIGERPVLLLDDVLSELDSTRRSFVLRQSSVEGQTLITTTDLGDLPAEFLNQAEVFKVAAGTVELGGG